MMNGSALASYRKNIFLIKLFFILLTVALIFAFLFFCRIKTVTVEGNVYSDEHSILDCAALKTGAHIYSIDKEAIGARIMANNPYVCSVSVRRTLPSSLHIIISEDKPCFYTAIGNKFYVLSQDLRILEVSDSSYTLSSRGIIPLVLSGIIETKTGEKLVFESKKGYTFNSGIIDVLMSSSFANSITSIDISQRFDINVMYKSKYTLVLGDYEELEKKLRFCAKTINYLETNMPAVAGTVYATGTEETSFYITGTVN